MNSRIPEYENLNEISNVLSSMSRERRMSVLLFALGSEAISIIEARGETSEDSLSIEDRLFQLDCELENFLSVYGPKEGDDTNRKPFRFAETLGE